MSRIIGKTYSDAVKHESTQEKHDNISLESMTVAQLTEMAADAGIAVPPNAKKADIIAVIEDAIAEENDGFKG